MKGKLKLELNSKESKSLLKHLHHGKDENQEPQTSGLRAIGAKLRKAAMPKVGR